MSYFSSFRVLAFLFWCSLLLLLLGFIVFWTLTYQAKRFLWQTLLLSIILNFADKFFLKNSRPQNQIYKVFLYLWAEMLSHILSWKRRTQMITFPVYGERSRPGSTGPLNSYGPGWVSRIPSIPELWQRSRNRMEKGWFGGIGPGSHSKQQLLPKSRAPGFVGTIAYQGNQLDYVK